MTVPFPTRVIWKSAELLIAFHKNKRREKRDEPFLWRPKDAIARLLAKPEDQEAVVVLRSDAEDEDVQIKMHPDKIVVRRDRALGWSGIIVDDDEVRVMVDGNWITIKSDGGVIVERDAEQTFLEGDGSIIKVSPDPEIIVSGDGERISRRSEESIAAISPDGVVSRRR